MKRDLYDFPGILERAEVMINSLNISPGELERILGFRDQCFADGLSVVRVAKYMPTLKRLYQMAPGEISTSDQKGLISILAKIERSEWQPWTKHDYKLTLRKYLQHCGRKDLTELIKLPKGNTHKLPEEMLTTEDIQVLLQAASPKDYVLIFLLWETGARIGEILSLRRKNVQMDAIGALLIVEGKTGMRRIRIIESAPHLDEWISCGSHKPDDLIFPDSYPALRKRLRSIAVRAGIGKRIYPHLFRHSRATFLASYLTEAQLCSYMGWTIGSQMARIYVHLNGSDLDLAMMKIPAIMPKVQSLPKDLNGFEGLKC